MLPKEIVNDSPGFVFSALESSPIFSGPMLASSCAFESAGMVAGSNATLWGPPLTVVNLMASPDLMVRLAGSKRYPFASPTIFISCVAPVIGAIVALPAAGAVAGAAVAGAVAGGVEVSTATLVVSAALLLSPPAQAPKTTALAASANPKNRILSNLRYWVASG